MATSQDFVNWVCGPELEPAFLAYLLQASRWFIRSLASGAVHKTVYMPTVEAFEVCVPSLERQRAILTELDSLVDRVKTLADSARAELEMVNSLPDALLRRAFGDERLDGIP
jgi:type I restriction enzyme S subunit